MLIKVFYGAPKARSNAINDFKHKCKFVSLSQLVLGKSSDRV